MTHEQLKRRWGEIFWGQKRLNLVQRKGLQTIGQVARAWDLLAAHYSREGLRYHTLAHLMRMFEELDAARAGGMAVEQLEVLELAIFGHNVEYVAGDAGHLYASARYMAQLLDRLGMSLQFCLLIVDLISATSDEYTLGRTPDQKLIYDLDHAVFKSDAREFDILCQQLEAEYTQFTTITEYAAARSAYLQALLDRPTVFRTQYFQQYESLARENIQREIDRLSHAGGF